jgi:glutathione synthase/RimK-type ligase-like ATP-grasp enzyme
MSPRIAILTPAANGAYGGGRWPALLARLASLLEAAGIRVEAADWTDDGDLSGFDLVLPLLAWGYHSDGDWPGRLDTLEASGARLRNPAAVLRWNADKAYLGRLAEAGAPIVPTAFVDRVDEAALIAAAERFGTDRLIAKPTVSAGAYRTIRWSPGTALDDAPERAAMIQPYLPDIEAGGEISLLYFDGRFSHAIRKRPQPGDFRVQPEFDGIITAHTPDADEIAAADLVLSCIDEDLLYARIDLVRDVAGRPVLMEAELVEPELYLEHDGNAGAAFTEAVGRALRVGSPV